jgi:hypothetical protein
MKGDGTVSVFRNYLEFDTSSIPDNANITDVKLNMKVYQDYSIAYDFNLEIWKHAWSSPLSALNRQANYEASGAVLDQIWRNTSGISTNVYYTNTTSLDPTWVNTSGTTQYLIRSSLDKYDERAGYPLITGAETLIIYSADHSTTMLNALSGRYLALFPTWSSRPIQMTVKNH